MTTDLDALRALDAARQPVPVPGYFRFPPTDADSAWLAAISNAGPALIEEVATLRARVAEQDAMLEEHEHAAWERSERD